MNRHWTVDELVECLYEIRKGDEHLSSCGECSRQLRELQTRRASAIGPVLVSTGLLAAQRQAVLGRIEAPSRRMLRWAPALTAVCLLAIGVLVYRPMHAPLPRQEQSDAQLFADIYSVEESAEPRAAGPIHELFQDGQP